MSGVGEVSRLDVLARIERALDALLDGEIDFTTQILDDLILDLAATPERPAT